MSGSLTSFRGFLFDTLFLSRLSPELDHYRILVIRVLTYLLVFLLTVESVTAFASGYFAIGVVEVFCIGVYIYTLTKTAKEPHVLGNLFIVVFFLITITAMFSAFNKPVSLFFLAIIPVSMIFFLGLKKSVFWISLIMLVFLGNLLLYFIEFRHLPWDANLFAAALIVFVFCLFFTIAYEKTNQMVLIKLQSLADYDELTHIFNRRKFYETLQQQIDEFQRYKEDFSLAILDIDYFKAVNDKFGHQAGDVVLQEIVNVTKNNLRKSDMLARYGGEEFVIILPHSSVGAAKLAMEKLRQSIEKHDFPMVSRCTVSIGVSQYLENDTGKALIQRADAALYAAKNAGRNRVACKLTD